MLGGGAFTHHLHAKRWFVIDRLVLCFIRVLSRCPRILSCKNGHNYRVWPHLFWSRCRLHVRPSQTCSFRNLPMRNAHVTRRPEHRMVKLAVWNMTYCSDEALPVGGGRRARSAARDRKRGSEEKSETVGAEKVRAKCGTRTVTGTAGEAGEVAAETGRARELASWRLPVRPARIMCTFSECLVP